MNAAARRLAMRALAVCMAAVIALAAGCKRDDDDDDEGTPQATYYTITYHSNPPDGSADATRTQSVAAGTAPTLDTVKALGFAAGGYAMRGWSTTARGAAAYAEGASLPAMSGDMTLYAVWAASAAAVSGISAAAPAGYAADMALEFSTTYTDLLGESAYYAIRMAAPPSGGTWAYRWYLDGEALGGTGSGYDLYTSSRSGSYPAGLRAAGRHELTAACTSATGDTYARSLEITVSRLGEAYYVSNVQAVEE